MLRHSASQQMQLAARRMQARPAALAVRRCSPACASSTDLNAIVSARSFTIAASAAGTARRSTAASSARLHTSAAHFSQEASSRSAHQQHSDNGAQRANEPPLPPPSAPPPKVMRSLAAASPAPSSSKTAKPTPRVSPSSSTSIPSTPGSGASITSGSSSSSPSPATSTTTASAASKIGTAPQSSSVQSSPSAPVISGASSSVPAESTSTPTTPAAPAKRITLLQRAKGAYETLKFLFLFYLNGVKQIFRNRTRVLEVQARVKEGGRALSREEYQLIKYHNSDMRKLPLFLAIVLILEEVLPLVVIYAPGLLPSTCILPSQIAKIREKDEVRRSAAVLRLRAKEGGLTVAQGAEGAAATWEDEAKRVVSALDAAALKDLSVTFKLPTWGGSTLQRGRLASHLAYLRSDDALMAGSGSESGNAVADEVPQDVEGLERACSERGLRASGVDSLTMSEALRNWLSITEPSHASKPSVLDVLALPLKLYDVSTPHALSNSTPVASSASEGGVLAEAKAVAREVVAAEREIVEREKRVEEEVRRKEAEQKQSDQGPATASNATPTAATTSSSARP
ncbi:hypothetical protein A4X13_0g6729 [Tilletia indica]|uniref:Uncharacterized protein n=1 Tax=Tilletia indica TaxID=43049 RepID=A0A177T969_9BASI|nr:hypothetical protein A4X13_0g6729 [Tilletia indica]